MTGDGGGRHPGLLIAEGGPTEAVPKDHTGGGQADVVLVGAVKQGVAQFLFQLSDLAAHRGLRDIQILRRSGKTHVFRRL